LTQDEIPADLWRFSVGLDYTYLAVGPYATDPRYDSVWMSIGDALDGYAPNEYQQRIWGLRVKGLGASSIDLPSLKKYVVPSSHEAGYPSLDVGSNGEVVVALRQAQGANGPNRGSSRLRTAFSGVTRAEIVEISVVRYLNTALFALRSALVYACRMPDRPEIKYKTVRPHLDAVCEALRQANGLVEPAARLLQMDGSNLRKYIRTHATCQAVQWEARQKLGDLAESKLVAMVNAGDYRAVALVLTTICRDRGYVLPKGAALNGEVVGTVTIGSVTINPVRSGEFLVGPAIEIDGRAVHGGRLIEPDDDDKSRLN
jgi:hypothetical protein